MTSIDDRLCEFLLLSQMPKNTKQRMATVIEGLRMIRVADPPRARRFLLSISRASDYPVLHRMLIKNWGVFRVLHATDLIELDDLGEIVLKYGSKKPKKLPSKESCDVVHQRHKDLLELLLDMYPPDGPDATRKLLMSFLQCLDEGGSIPLDIIPMMRNAMRLGTWFVLEHLEKTKEPGSHLLYCILSASRECIDIDPSVYLFSPALGAAEAVFNYGKQS